MSSSKAEESNDELPLCNPGPEAVSVTTSALLGRRLSAAVPLILVATTILVVAVVTMILPTRSRREVGVDLVRELTRFARVLAA
jgi:hypothetical protein